VWDAVRCPDDRRSEVFRKRATNASVATFATDAADAANTTNAACTNSAAYTVNATCTAGARISCALGAATYRKGKHRKPKPSQRPNHR
jgi:hypothetical protein